MRKTQERNQALADLRQFTEQYMGEELYTSSQMRAMSAITETRVRLAIYSYLQGDFMRYVEAASEVSDLVRDIQKFVILNKTGRMTTNNLRTCLEGYPEALDDAVRALEAIVRRMGFNTTQVTSINELVGAASALYEGMTRLSDGPQKGGDNGEALLGILEKYSQNPARLRELLIETVIDRGGRPFNIGREELARRWGEWQRIHGRHKAHDEASEILENLLFQKQTGAMNEPEKAALTILQSFFPPGYLSKKSNKRISEYRRKLRADFPRFFH